MKEMGLEPETGAGWGKLLDQVVSAFVEPKLIQPTFLTDYPVELSPLAKRKPDDPRYVERFEIFADGFELGNAYTELNDPLEQRQRFELQARLRAAGDEEAELLDEDFLDRARARHAAHRRPRRRHRPPGDAAVRQALDPGGDPVPGAEGEEIVGSWTLEVGPEAPAAVHVFPSPIQSPTSTL